MWAEIHNKIPSNLAGLEDMLTGNFFGLLQYADTSLLASVLEAASFPFDKDEEGEKAFKKLLEGLHSGTLQPKYNFWPHKDRRFIDLLIQFPDHDYLLGIEVKYLSGISRNDDITLEPDSKTIENERLEEVKRSKHQLLEYAHCYAKNDGTPKAFFLIWACTEMASDIINGIATTPKQMEEVKCLQAKKAYLGQMTWQHASKQLLLASKTTLDPINKKIINDLIDYLKAKQLDGFLSFDDVHDLLVNPNDFFSFDPENNMNNDEQPQNANIFNAIQVLIKSYDGIKKLFNELHAVGITEGYKSKGSRYPLTWLSSKETYGWLPRHFVKVFNKKDIENELYTVEANLQGLPDGTPVIILGRHQYEILHSIGNYEDAANFNHRIWNTERYTFEPQDGIAMPFDQVFYSEPRLKVGDWGKQKGFRRACFIKVPLLNFKSNEIKSKIFKNMDKLDWAI